MTTTTKSRAPDPAFEWGTRMLAAIAAFLLFETLSGLAIFLMPFSVLNQFFVIAHTAAGVICFAPYVWYQARHIWVWRDYPMSHIKVLGYLTFAATSVCCISGFILTVQAAFGTRIEYYWDMVHLVTTFAILAAGVPHIALVLAHRWKGAEAGSPIRLSQILFLNRTCRMTAVLLALPLLAALLLPQESFRNEFPENYSWKFGKDRPFAPSLAVTASGGAYEPRSLAESRRCGTSGCHSEIYEEWLPSAHRYASMDPGFQKVQALMAENIGPESTRYCGGCHDPIALFSGSKNLYNEDLSSHGADEGISCTVCHSIVQTDLKGNANYTLAQPDYYAFELSDSKAGKFVSDFLIRAYPEHHKRSFTKDLYKTPEYCGACHKQFIDEEINNVGWVQLQNQYDNWRKSRWHTEGNPKKTLTCRECHMRLKDSMDPSAGDHSDYYRRSDDNKHRSHRFIAANQFIPAALKLPGYRQQVQLTEEWLRGETIIPEIADRWSAGPSVPIRLIVPEHATEGEAVKVKAVITNNKVGHSFPTGPLDIIQGWVDFKVTDGQGNTIYRSGSVDKQHFIQPGTFMFKAEAIDRNGNLIDRHNLWEMVGARFKRTLFPGFSDTADYQFQCPAVLAEAPEKEPGPPPGEITLEVPKGTKGPLRVRAVLRYRKVDQFMLNLLFGEESGLTSTVTDISEAEAEI
ncbi:MAG: multiheme c-type cytochrome, partial [Planctomycetota bacterium]|nr:multiheme c-type cytochrome [Planctomycetota bacterium]